MFQFASSPGCVPSKAMKICMNSTGVNKIEQTDKLLLETLHETRSMSEEEEEEGEGSLQKLQFNMEYNIALSDKILC